MNTIIVTTGVNGGKSTISFPVENFIGFDIGKDNLIRILLPNDKKTYPVIEILQGPDSFKQTYADTKAAITKQDLNDDIPF